MRARPDFSHLNFREFKTNQNKQLGKQWCHAIAICYVECCKDIDNGDYEAGRKPKQVGFIKLSSLHGGERYIYMHKDALVYYGHKFLRDANFFNFLFKPKQERFASFYGEHPEILKRGKALWWLPIECVKPEIEYALSKKGDYSYACLKEEGIPESLANVRNNLAERYAAEDKGFKKNYSEAYFWYSLAASDSGFLSTKKAKDVAARRNEIENGLTPEQKSTIEVRVRDWDLLSGEEKFLEPLQELIGNGPAYFYGYQSDRKGPELLTWPYLKIGEGTKGRADKKRYIETWYPGGAQRPRWRIPMKGKQQAQAAEELFKAIFGLSWTKWSDTGKRDLDEYFIAEEEEIQQIAKTLGDMWPPPKSTKENKE